LPTMLLDRKRPSRRRLERAKTRRLPRSLPSSLETFLFLRRAPPQTMTTRWCQSKYIREKKPVITTKALSSQEDVVVGKSSESRLLLVVAPPRAAAAGNHRRFCRRGLKSSLKESRLLHAPNVAPMIWYSSKQKRDATQSGVCCAFVCCIITLSFSLQSLFFSWCAQTLNK
jgi:hypothetical protein